MQRLKHQPRSSRMTLELYGKTTYSLNQFSMLFFQCLSITRQFRPCRVFSTPILMLSKESKEENLDHCIHFRGRRIKVHFRLFVHTLFKKLKERGHHFELQNTKSNYTPGFMSQSLSLATKSYACRYSSKFHNISKFTDSSLLVVVGRKGELSKTSFRRTHCSNCQHLLFALKFGCCCT